MSFTAIQGTFHVVGYSPDGDSIRFKAHDDDLWDQLDGRAKLNDKGHAQLRIEAIDTLETHYDSEHQPIALARQATDALMTKLGITDIQWDSHNKRVISANDGTEGFILSRQTDKFGRPISFVFGSELGVADGAAVFLDDNNIVNSVNYRQLLDGLAYPTYYQGLFADLRATLNTAYNTAKSGSVGIWAVDKTTSGFAVDGLHSITDEHVILPKLFRRLVAFLKQDSNLGNFLDYLRNKPEGIKLEGSNQDTTFDSIISVVGNTVKLTVDPAQIIFMPT